MFSVPLNSFVHRVHDKAQVLDYVSRESCSLKRVRRSRHWLLTGSEEQLRKLQSTLSDEHDLWIKDAIDKSLPTPIVCLEGLLVDTPNLTLKQLVSLSGCSMAEARLAMDEFEGLS
ncbi:ribosome recycling factor family protein [Vibrio kagoshimensis]|uniref:ribosome recycling factor family protein n=1 Tax=Vibrio kagoshimensis TaxID=2910244 RepID=UPI003D2561DC